MGKASKESRETNKGTETMAKLKLAIENLGTNASGSEITYRYTLNRDGRTARNRNYVLASFSFRLDQWVGLDHCTRFYDRMVKDNYSEDLFSTLSIDEVEDFIRVLLKG